MSKDSDISEKELKEVMNILKAKPTKKNNPEKPFKMPKSDKLHFPDFKPIRDEDHW